VTPDGRGLLPGASTAAAGKDVYTRRCETCHGPTGKEGPQDVLVGGQGSLATSRPQKTIGSYWPYATTLWDYIRRAMPFTAPQTLTVDETYALTAYVLYLNDILPADAALDHNSLVALKLPNRDGFTTRHGFLRRGGRPDTRNVACMRDCEPDAKLASQIPDYARDDHGNLAEQTRALGTAAARKAPPAPPVRDTLALAKQSACMACHGLADRLVGPGFREVATKYAGDPAAEARLATKLRTGGGGTWGAVPMPAQPQLNETDAKALIRWILAGAK